MAATAKQKQLQDELSRAATKANEKLGELRSKHGISDEDWGPIAEHHNAIIAAAQDAIDSTTKSPKATKKK